MTDITIPFTVSKGDDILDMNLLSLDLQSSVKILDGEKRAYEAVRLIPDNGSPEFGALLFIPDAQRAGINMGGESVWTDADSVEDAIHRFNTNTMCN